MVNDVECKEAEIPPTTSTTELDSFKPDVGQIPLVNEILNGKDSEDASIKKTKFPQKFRLSSNPFLRNEESKISKGKMEGLPRLEVELEAVQNSNQARKKGWKKFWDRTMADMKNKKLRPIKLLFFFKSATLFVLYPFLTLHIKSLGMDAAEAGINSAFTPVVAILGPPVAGIIADKIGNFKVLLSAMTLVTGGLALLLLLVPVARERVVLPEDIIFSLTCGNGLQQQHQSMQPHSLPISQLLLETTEKGVCTLDLSKTPWRNLHPSEIRCGKICPVKKSSDRLLPPYSIPSLPLNGSIQYLLPGKKSTFSPSFVRVPSLVCSHGGNVTCYLAFAEIASSNATTTVPIEFTELKLFGKDAMMDKKNVTQVQFAIQGSFKFGSQKFEKVPACISTDSDISSTGSSLQCVDKCLVTYKRKLFCSNVEDTIVYDVQLTFWLYTLFRIILGLGSATTWVMFEGAVLAILKECGGDYGLQRVSALLAAVLVCPLSGSLIYFFQDFRPAFYLYAILQCISAFLTLKIDLAFKTPAEKVLGHLKEVLSRVEILIFFCAMLLSGSAWGYLESFLFWFLKNMGGTEILMGLTISVGGLAGLPLLIFSRAIIKRTGHVSVLCFGLLFYSIRLFGYSFIKNPWMCLPFEAMEAITSSLAITAAATYAAALSTEQTIASVQGIMGALYFGIGRGAGSVTGGFLIQWYGERTTFQIFGVAAFISSVIYSILNVAYIRGHSRVKLGLDINNLRGDRFQNDEVGTISAVNDSNTRNPETENAANNPTPSPTEFFHEALEDDQGLTSTEDPIVSPSDQFGFIAGKDNAGYTGSNDNNLFTDVPLDEDGIVECRNTIKRRPASFPQKSKVHGNEPQRSAEN